MANSCRSMGWILGIDAVVYVSELSLALIPIALLRGLCTRGEVHQRAVLNWMEIKEKVTAAKPDARWIDFFYTPLQFDIDREPEESARNLTGC